MTKMSPRERTLAAINHELPDKVPGFIMGIDEWADYCKSREVEDPSILLEEWGQGTNRFPIGLFDLEAWGDSKKTNVEGKWIDPWGSSMNCWGFGGNLAKPSASVPSFVEIRTGPQYHPLAGAETVADVEAHAWPDPEEVNFAPLRKGFENRPDLLCFQNLWQPVLCRLFDLFGMEQALLNFYTNPAVIEAALAHIDAFYDVFYERQLQECGHAMDIFAIGDDFAGNDGLLIRPEHWRKYLAPFYRKWLALGKDAGKITMMHSCGAIREVLPDLVDMGMDIWETVQAHLPGNEPEGLKRDFGRHLTFAGGIDTQHVLSLGTPDEVRAHVRERIRVLGRGGGYLCGPDHTVRGGTPFENITALFDTVVEYAEEGVTR